MRKLLIPSYGTRYTPLPRQKTLSPFQVGVGYRIINFKGLQLESLLYKLERKKSQWKVLPNLLVIFVLPTWSD